MHGCQHFVFQAKKSLDREKPFSLALRVVSLFSCLSRLASSFTRVTICVSCACCSTDKEKRETARSLWWWRENNRNVMVSRETIEIWWWWCREREKLFYMLERTSLPPLSFICTFWVPRIIEPELEEFVGQKAAVSRTCIITLRLSDFNSQTS